MAKKDSKNEGGYSEDNDYYLNWLQKRVDESKDDGSFTYGVTPKEWEQLTGNKLLSYSTRPSSGYLSKLGNMSYITAAELKKQEEEKQKGLEEEEARKSSAYGLLSQAPSESYNNFVVGSSFNKMIGGNGGGGFIGSMGGLEAASMRLADAASKREAGLIGIRGIEETGLQKLRGQQETSLQGLRGQQEKSLQELRGEQEYGLGKWGKKESSPAGSFSYNPSRVTPLPDMPGYGTLEGKLYKKGANNWYMVSS
jgi:hypothetical protein